MVDRYNGPHQNRQFTRSPSAKLSISQQEPPPRKRFGSVDRFSTYGCSPTPQLRFISTTWQQSASQKTLDPRTGESISISAIIFCMHKLGDIDCVRCTFNPKRCWQTRSPSYLSCRPFNILWRRWRTTSFEIYPHLLRSTHRKAKRAHYTVPQSHPRPGECYGTYKLHASLAPLGSRLRYAQPRVEHVW